MIRGLVVIIFHMVAVRERFSTFSSLQVLRRVGNGIIV
jgi:hypothetical protein